MIKKTEITKPTQSFTDFVSTHKMVLEKANIPTHCYTRLYNSPYNSFDIFSEDVPLKEIRLQLLTGELQFYKQHFDIIRKNLELTLFAAMSGKLDTLNWVYNNQLIATAISSNVFFDPEDSNVSSESIFAFALVQNKDIDVLEWAFDKQLMSTELGFHLILEANWLEGFLWLINKFPEFLFDKQVVPKSYYEKLFEILQTGQPEYRNSLSKYQYLWLLGDLQYYEQYEDKISEQGMEMLLAAARTGQIEILDWLFDKLALKSASELWAYLKLPDHEMTLLKNIFLRNFVLSKNCKVLDWALAKQLIDNPELICIQILYSNWLDGFIWINSHFPMVSSKQTKTNNIGFGVERPIHILAELNQYQIHAWCKQNKPALLHQRDALGRTMVHRAAEFNNIGVLNWFKDHFPILFDCNDNKKDETIMHIGVLYEHLEVIKFGLNYDKELVHVEDNSGLDVVNCALTSKRPTFFNAVLSFTKSPLHLKTSNGFKTLNTALESNFRLSTLSFENESEAMLQEEYSEIMSKLERNKLINTLILFLTAFLESNSNLTFFPIDIFNQICQKAMRLYYPEEKVFKFHSQMFLKKEAEDLEVALDTFKIPGY